MYFWCLKFSKKNPKILDNFSYYKKAPLFCWLTTFYILGQKFVKFIRCFFGKFNSEINWPLGRQILNLKLHGFLRTFFLDNINQSRSLWPWLVELTCKLCTRDSTKIGLWLYYLQRSNWIWEFYVFIKYFFKFFAIYLRRHRAGKYQRLVSDLYAASLFYPK